MTTQDPELSAALGWPGGISDPVLDRKVLLQMVAALRLASQQALEALEDLADCGAEAWSEQRPCVQIGREAITALRAALAQQAEPVEQLAELQAMLRAEVDRLIAAGIQPQRKPLTEEEIERIGMKHVTLREVIRAVERAHGIKE